MFSSEKLSELIVSTSFYRKGLFLPPELRITKTLVL